jgi:hypothetical protein
MPIFTPSDVTEPAASLRSVTPHASNSLPDGVCRALWVGGAGDVSVIAENDTTAVLIAGLVAGSLLPVRVKAVRAVGTTAANIVALY